MASFAISFGISLGFQLLGALLTPPVEVGKLKSKKVPKSDYGVDIPRIRGCMPLTGQIIWSPKDYREEKRKRGKLTGKQIQYTYYGDFAYAFNAGRLAGINRLKLNGETKVNFLTAKANTIKSSVEFLDNYVTLYDGSETQGANPTIQQVDGIANTPAYRGVSYLFLKNYPLTESGDRPPTIEAIAYTAGGSFSKDYLAGNHRPVVWVSTNGATIQNAEDNAVLGQRSFLSGDGKSGYEVVPISAGLFSVTAVEVEYIFKGTGVYGIAATLPSGTYSAPIYRFETTGSAISPQLKAMNGSTSLWQSTVSYPDGAMLAIQVKGQQIQFFVNGQVVATAAVSILTQNLYIVSKIFSGQVGAIRTDGIIQSTNAIDPTPINLREQLTEICAVAGITNVDVTQIDPSTQFLGVELDPSGEPKTWITQLQQLYFFDVFQRGDTLVFRDAAKGASVRTFTPDDLACSELDSSRPDLFKIESTNPSELPSEVVLKFYDARDSNLRQRTVYSRAETNPSLDKLSLSVEAALTVPQAQAIADIVLHGKWFQKKVSFTMSIAHCDLEPGDVITLPILKAQKRCMLTKMTLGSNLLFECEATTQEDVLFSQLVLDPTFRDSSSSVGGSFDNTYYVALRIPRFRANDPSPVLYFGVGGGGKSWRTAYLNASPDEQLWESIASTITESTLGTASSVLAASTGIDTVNTLTVRLYSGALQSISADVFAAGGVTNLLRVGSEIIRFRDATLTAPNTYTLSYFDRGRDSTPTGPHGVAESVALLSTLQAIALEPDQTGPLKFKVTFDQQTLDQAPTATSTAPVPPTA
jgi:hypothetical protein